MNDFTKEELEDFVTWGESYIEFGSSWVDKVHRSLIDKIQSMIDNYCEHEICKHVLDGKFYDLLGRECNLAETMHFKLKCKICGELYR